jgi:hypothetical protein
MPPPLMFFPEPLPFLPKWSYEPYLADNSLSLTCVGAASLLLIAATLLVHFAMRYPMPTLLLVCGPTQLLRSVPYDIRAFILAHSRVSILVLRLTSHPLLSATKNTWIKSRTNPAIDDGKKGTLDMRCVALKSSHSQSPTASADRCR